MRVFRHIIIYISLAALLFASCAKPKPRPRPMAYFRINFPQKQYTLYKPDTCPYSFEVPVYAKIVPFTGKTQGSHHCWITVVFPQFKAELTITYYPVRGNLEQLIDDSYTLAYKHSIRADDIKEKQYIDTAHRVYATVFDITGNAASPMQFHITDSTRHFFRGSLYFKVRPNRDSLQPAIDFIEADVKKLIETFRWQ